MANIYKQIDGIRYDMEKREKSNRRDEFPDSGEYTQKFNEIERFLNKHVHKEVLTGATLNNKGLITDHGADHVNMVINRATMILGDKIQELKGFEIFILLLAIHFHDVGNIYGREKHEERIMEVIEDLGEKLPLDRPSKVMIAQIAMSHSGKTEDNSLDTISNLVETEHLQGILIRPALLASILRFADEISDDHTRAARYLYAAKEIPPENQVYHDYSKCLQPAAVSGQTLVLKYDIPFNLAVQESTKVDVDQECGWRKVFLYDEILERLVKCRCELEYCRKYSQGFITISCVQADICVFKPKVMLDIYKDSIRLRIAGYPSMLNDDIIKLCVTPPRASSGSEMKEIIESYKEV